MHRTARRDTCRPWLLASACLALAACPSSDSEPGPSQNTGAAGSSATSGARAGAAGEDATCASPRGVYMPVYTLASGSCGPITDTGTLTVGNGILITKLAAVDIETETILMGCSLQLVQITRTKDGQPQRRIRGTLTIEPDETLAGEVTLTLYDESGQASCDGTYSATLTRDPTTLGGAASG